jgi:hypothetical protein
MTEELAHTLPSGEGLSHFVPRVLGIPLRLLANIWAQQAASNSADKNTHSGQPIIMAL